MPADHEASGLRVDSLSAVSAATTSSSPLA